ncbi:S41 family peptidase [Patescibacteria group bacterium]|nr:S41 family peptidase [Patescibacteria group bacterium]
MSKFFKKSIFAGGLVAIVIAIFMLGIYLGYSNRPAAIKVLSVFNKQDPVVSQELDFNSFWKTWNIIESKYVSNDGLDKQKMLWGAISGLVGSLGDPYSSFFPPKEAGVFESSVRGDFEGVGMEIGIKNNILTVVAPLKGTPADMAGMKPGDKILKIEDTLTADLTVEEAVQLIRGEKGTKVALSILREGTEEPFQVEIVRDVIQIPVLETEKKDGGIFVINLFSFSGRSVNEFRNALREMIDSGSSKLILDLRGNPGGYLDAAVDIASWFLPMGDVVAREQFSDDHEELYRSKGYNVFNNLPMVILINEGSASASEIVAGALSEHGKATLVGKKTYGKGSVQEMISIENGSSLKLTIARWLTPNGKSISKEGLEPDISVEFTKEDYEAGRDPQMEKAIEVLNK